MLSRPSLACSNS